MSAVRPHPRFVLSSVTGYPINPNGSTGGRKSTSFAVLDRWWNHREVFSAYTSTGVTTANCESKARAALERLNREHDAWLAEARTTP